MEIFKSYIRFDHRLYLKCKKHIAKHRRLALLEHLISSVEADCMFPEQINQHDEFLKPDNEYEQKVWESCREMAKTDIQELVKKVQGGIKSAEIRKQKAKSAQPKPAVEPQKEEPKKAAPSFISPTLEEVLEYAREQSSFAGCGGFACTPEQAEEFWSYYESQEWRIGNDTNTPIRDWKPKLRQWCVKAKQDSMKQAIKTIKKPTVLNLSARERQDLINKQKTEMLLKQLHAQEN